MNRSSLPVLFVALVILVDACWGESASPCLGPPGLSATYQIADSIAPRTTSVVESFTMSVGPEEDWRGTKGQWLHLEFKKKGGMSFEAWLLCKDYPSGELTAAGSAVLRYMLKLEGKQPVEYQHAVTGLAVLPSSGAWPWLLPRAAGEDDTESFAKTLSCLGHRYSRRDAPRRETVDLPGQTRVVALRPDVLTGVPHNTRQKNEARRYDDSEYEYVPLVRADLESMMAAGINCFRAEPEQAAWYEDAGVFYWGVDPSELPYPECLYQPLYLGPALFLDEPAVVTRDHTLRPRLREEASFRRNITPQHAMAAFETHYEEVVTKGQPASLCAKLAERDDVDLGDMRFPQANLYTWETMVSSAAYQLLHNPETPGAVVFEPPGQLGTQRTLPGINMTYGCQIPVTGDHFIDIIIGFLRGAARVSGKQWGVSIYGGVDRTDAPSFISRAYELGATRFFYWDSARLACVPFGEVLDLTRHLAIQAREYPNRDLDRLRNAAEVAILFPPGFNLGHVYMGKGLLWGLTELNLERKNREGVPYRTVMGHFFTEIERCLRLGVAFDLLWDLPNMKVEGYREVVRVREDGKVEIARGGERFDRDGARIPPRPEGQPPRLSVSLPENVGDAPSSISAQARVIEGDAPVYYAPAPDRNGVHHNKRVAWELYGPNEEDYSCRTPEITPGLTRPQPEGGHVADVVIRINERGRYRLRAATTDLAGRTTVVWKEIDVGP